MNKIAVLADIHGNLKALKTALNIVREEQVDRIFVCGDVVGYGEQPNQCCKTVRSLDCPVVAGNHDWAVAGLTEYKDTHSADAIKGIEYPKTVVTPQNLSWLKGLPLYHRGDETEFAHSSLIEPEGWHYLTLGTVFKGSAFQDVRETFQIMKGQI